MKKIFLIFVAISSAVTTFAETFVYNFNSVRLSEALSHIAEDHPSLNLNFIYNELENYTTSARINTTDAKVALSNIIGLNPVSVIKNGDRYYVEAMQHGRYTYTGRAVGTDSKPVAAATVMLLTPKDSTVITYGITDGNGRFSIPCDIRCVIGKLTCLGYKPTYRTFSTFSVGTIVMPEKAIVLSEVSVDADNARLYSDKSVFIPTTRQKNASQTGIDLLDHMAIPQLDVATNNSIVTNSGKPVVVFIDYLPASDYDLSVMRVSDVRRVEFYEYPSDARLQGYQYVVNFILQKYEYGGYVKGFGHTNFISNPVGEILGNVRTQYKKMTYDVMASAFAYDRNHIGSELTETFRLPQSDGTTEEFTRHSNTTDSKDKQQWYFATVRAIYQSEKIQALSQVSGKIDRKPDSRKNGTVTYFPEDFNSTTYASTHFNQSKFVSYQGFYFFALPRGNSLTFAPQYTYSHTNEHSSYTESGLPAIFNSAIDNTIQMNTNLKFSHNWGKYGTLLGFVRGHYEYNRTSYAGSATASERAKSSRIGIGTTYSITSGNFYGATGFGWDWDRLQFGNMTDAPSSPWFDLSVQYSIRQKHSLSTTFHYNAWQPSPNYKSDAIVQSSHLLSYTGNPNLTPSKSYDIDLTYTWIPNNNYSLNAFAWAWIVGDRYVYDYEATPTGILRTIKQPMGSFAQGQYGINWTLRFLDRSLAFYGKISQVLNHNGKPYNVNHSYIAWTARVRYYLKNWHFTLSYISDRASADGSMNGLWYHAKNDWYVTIGWSDDKWNFRGDIINFTRWNRRNAKIEMQSRWYDTKEVFINGKSRAYVQLTATYTIGFGKKVTRDNAPAVNGSASSGILK